MTWIFQSYGDIRKKTLTKKLIRDNIISEGWIFLNWYVFFLINGILKKILYMSANFGTSCMRKDIVSYLAFIENRRNNLKVLIFSIVPLLFSYICSSLRLINSQYHLICFGATSVKHFWCKKSKLHIKLIQVLHLNLSFARGHYTLAYHILQGVFANAKIAQHVSIILSYASFKI